LANFRLLGDYFLWEVSFHCKSYVLMLTKMFWATFWAIFFQKTHLVTLLFSHASEIQRFVLEVKPGRALPFVRKRCDHSGSKFTSRHRVNLRFYGNSPKMSTKNLRTVK
jgi:hypothetical protein